jgi:hypothetical protein
VRSDRAVEIRSRPEDPKSFSGVGLQRRPEVQKTSSQIESHANRSERNSNDQQKHQKTNKPEKKATKRPSTMRAAFLYERSISAKGSASAETKALKKANIGSSRSRT